MNLRKGTLLKHGEYRIERFINSGGFGCTYVAEHMMLEKRVAIKEFFVKDFCNRDSSTARISVATQGKQALVEKLKSKFIEEAKALAHMHHPGIVNVSDVFEENGTAYYVMDYIEGCSLHATLEHEGKLSEERALGYIRQVAEALAYVHAQHRLHLDVKPGNIMVDEKGNATLIDFGTSKQYDEENGENTSTVQGYTKGFAPPEQMTNDVVKFMPSTDIYALGATLYKLLTGITPPSATLRISGEGLAALPASVSAATEQAIEQAMRLNKALRPQTIDAFLALLGTPSTVADDEETDLDIDDNKDDDVNHRGDEHKGKSGLSLRMKKLLWPIVVCVAVALGFWGVKLYNDYCAKRQAYIQAYIAAKRDMTKFSVVTTPSGATVYIDGKKMGITPIEGEEIACGNHEVKLSKEGYEDKTLTRTFGEKLVGLNVTLTEKPEPQTQIVQQPVISSSSSLNPPDVTGKINGHEYVDLGLSVKWATCNVGATSPSDYGNYYSWGEINVKREYSNSKIYEKSIDCIAGNSLYDAARANWGETWRLPTKAEFQELIDMCSWIWVSQGGRNGFRVTGPSGGSIFLPAAGWYSGSMRYRAGMYGRYWSSTSYGNGKEAYSLYIGESGCDMAEVDYYYGRSIRPVCKDNKLKNRRGQLEQIKQLSGDEVKDNAPKFGI